MYKTVTSTRPLLFALELSLHAESIISVRNVINKVNGKGKR